jgi:hypothetical protein
MYHAGLHNTSQPAEKTEIQEFLCGSPWSFAASALRFSEFTTKTTEKK